MLILVLWQHVVFNLHSSLITLAWCRMLCSVSHAAQHTTHNHNQAHSKQRMTRTQKHDMLQQHQS